MVTLNDIVDNVMEKGVTKEAESLEGVLGEGDFEKLSSDEIKEASKYAQMGRDLAENQINKVAKERKQIADEYGRDTLESMDKAASAQQYGRSLAREQMQKVAAQQQQMQKQAAQYQKLASEYGEEEANSILKAAHFDQAGRELAHLAVMNEQ